MAEYKDAKAVKQVVMEVSGVSFPAMSIRLLAALDKLPAADVEPVRHGHWQKPLDKRRRGRVCCSECYGIFWASWNYCPNCGAKMAAAEGEMV